MRVLTALMSILSLITIESCNSKVKEESISLTEIIADFCIDSATHVLHLATNNSIITYHYEIVSSNSELVKKGELGEGITEIDLSGLNTGIYSLTVIETGEVYKFENYR